MPSPRIATSAAVALIAIAAIPAAAQTEPPRTQGAVMQQGGAVPQNPTLPQLNLSNPQREQIRKAVLTEHNDVGFQLTEEKAAKDFNPAVGATLPTGLWPHGFPPPILLSMPALRDYGYVKMKAQVLIVDGMTRKIVDVFSETQPVT
jgi:hypothetical protein